MTVAIDLYFGNGPVNFDKMHLAGVDVVFLKAGGLSGTGGLYMDNAFKDNWKWAKAAGMLRGAYWFNNSAGGNANFQDEYFGDILHSVDPGEFPPTADFESRANSSTGHSLQVFHDFLEGVKKWTPEVTVGNLTKPIIYTGQSFWKESLASGLYWGPDRFWLWLAQYFTSMTKMPPELVTPTMWPLQPKPFSNEDFLWWQYTSHGADGIKYGHPQSLDVDLNVCRRDLDALYTLLKLDQPLPPPTPPQHPLTTDEKVDNFLWPEYLLKHPVPV